MRRFSDFKDHDYDYSNLRQEKHDNNSPASTFQFSVDNVPVYYRNEDNHVNQTTQPVYPTQNTPTYSTPSMHHPCNQTTQPIYPTLSSHVPPSSHGTIDTSKAASAPKKRQIINESETKPNDTIFYDERTKIYYKYHKLNRQVDSMNRLCLLYRATVEDIKLLNRNLSDDLSFYQGDKIKVPYSKELSEEERQILKKDNEVNDKKRLEKTIQYFRRSFPLATYEEAHYYVTIHDCDLSKASQEYEADVEFEKRTLGKSEKQGAGLMDFVSRLSNRLSREL